MNSNKPLTGETGRKLLDSYRVLDLTDEKGMYCGKLLGDLGADVIKIEKPGGDSSRNIGPFYHDLPEADKSLNWYALNANKKGITLNTQSLKGKDLLKRLVKDACFLIESFEPGYLDELGIGYRSLKEVNPRLIMTSITPFGQNGPYATYKASDLINMAMGGMQYSCGDSERPPVRISNPNFSYINGGVQAAAGTLIAHHYREQSGKGQHVDVSITECIPLLMVTNLYFWEYQREITERKGASRSIVQTTSLPHRYHYPTKDGYVCYAVFGGKTGSESNRKLVEWMDDEGNVPEFLKQIKWEKLDMVTESKETLQNIYDVFADFFLRHTKKELKEGAFERHIMLYPVQDAKDIVEDAQLQARDFFIDVEHEELNDVLKYAGVPFKSSEASISISRRAPSIGEHNLEIYGKELGLSIQEMGLLKQTGVI